MAAQPLAAAEIAAFRVLHLEAQPDADAVDLGYRGSVLLVDASEAASAGGGRSGPGGGRDGIVAMCRHNIWLEAAGENDADGRSESVAGMTVEEEEIGRASCRERV